MRVSCNEERMVVISDLHIGNPYSRARRLLKSFLAYVEEEGYSLCINGDGVDIAQTSFQRIATELPELLDALRRIAKRNSSVYYVVGNHDMSMDHFLDDWGLMTVVPFLNVHSGDSRIRIEHGHLYDPFFVKYPRLYEFATHLGGQLLKISPDFYRLWVKFEGHKNRMLAKLQGGDKSSLANEDPAFTAAARELLERGFDSVIFGHTHVPGVLQIGEDKSYVNAGSWLRNGNYVMIEQGQVQLREWN
jgi:UDP-2,3-diacylglucosamine pyrophosphatase LpxH